MPILQSVGEEMVSSMKSGKLSRRKLAFLEYIRSNPGCTPKMCFFACFDFLTGQARNREDFETEYTDLDALAKAGLIIKDREGHRGPFTLHSTVPEHHQLHDDFSSDF